MAMDGAGFDDRRWSLKRSTAGLHDWVEELASGAGAFASREGYRRYLGAIYAVRDLLERNLDASGAAAIFPDWPNRRIASLVAEDIADLGGRPPPLPASPTKPYGSRGEILGALYVLEGSSLGARLLTASAAKLGLSANFGARHLHHQAGDRTAWRNYLLILSNADLDATAELGCISAAEATFKVFGRAFQAYV